jgi:hypothetical protein
MVERSMKILLLVFLVNLESSYLQNVEREVREPADTVQFLLLGNAAWRIKTFSIDQDVHVWSIGDMNQENFESLAESNTQKHYGDVLAGTVRIEAAGDLNTLKASVQASVLGGTLEVPNSEEFAFWVREAGMYKTKSTPQ